MAFDISDLPRIQIYITDGWREWYIPKFRLYMEVSEPYITLNWTDTEKGVSGAHRELKLDYNDVTFGYTSPSSAAEIESVIENWIDQSWGTGGGAEWGDITGTLSDQTDLQTALNAKQAALVSGTNIKTVNGNSLLGSGDLVIKQTALFVQMLTNGWVSGTTKYYGSMPKNGTVSANTTRIYPGKIGTITIADINNYAATTAGSNENISLYIRLNDTTDYLVATVGLAAAERRFRNAAMSVPIANVNDFIEMKLVLPVFGTAPAGVFTAGYLTLVES